MVYLPEGSGGGWYLFAPAIKFVKASDQRERNKWSSQIAYLPQGSGGGGIRPPVPRCFKTGIYIFS